MTPGGDDQQGEGASRPGRGRPRWQFTEAAVLLLLTEGPSHGYQLLSRLRPMFPPNAAPPDATVLYRQLRRLEGDGSLRSNWAANPGAGPARHVYELTASGRHVLDGWVPSIAGEIQAMSGLLTAYYGAAIEDDAPDADR